ncbi:hypothetical protein Bca4012_058739 [Brassica carinata]
MMGNEETSQASASIEEESVNTKMNRIIEVMEENLKTMKDRMSLLEEENMQLKARVSELEGNQNVGPHTQTVVFPTNLTQQNETQPSNETPLSPMYQQNETQDFSPNFTREETMNESHASPKSQQIETQIQHVEKEPSDDTPALDTQVFTPNFTREETMNESHASPKSQQIETQIQHVEKEPSYDTPALDTQVFTPNLTQEIVRETLPSESLAAQTQVFQKETNETPASPKSIETQVFTPIQKQQEDTHVVHNTPSSPISSLISLVLEENKNALPSDEMPSEQNQAEENLQDTTEPTTETQPLNQQTKHLQTSAIDFSETEKVEENRLPILFEIGTDVEIASNDDTTSRIWYPAKVVDLNGVEKVTVEYYRTVFSEKKKVQNTITTEKIRLAPPTSFQKAFEMNDNVEGFYKNGWYSGKIKMVLGDNTYSVYLNSSMETIQFEPSHFRIHREWIDGVWKIADEMQTGYFKGPETQSQDLSQQDHVIEQKPNKKRKAAGSSQELGKDTVVPLLRRSERVPKRSRDTKTPFKSERNPALTVKREIISAVDPFSTPTDHKFQRLQNLLTSTGGVHGHIDGAFAMLNCRRNENAAWFHNNKIPKAYFLPTTFFPTLGYYIDLIETRPAEGKKIFADGQTELVRGEIYPKKKWGEDIWKTLDWNSRRLEKRTITLFHCGLPTEDKNNDISQIEELAVLIPALMMEAFGEEVNKKEVVPYKIEKVEGIPKTLSRFNCALFVLKMLECHSLKIEDMSKINDDNAMEPLKVTCILPPIPHDPEADVCIEDIADKCLEDIADLSKRDYKFKIREWDNMSIDLYAANEEIRRASLLFGNGEMGQASSSYPEESVESKINRNSQMVEDNFRIMNTRLCLIEKDSKEIKVRVTELEKLKRATSYETLNNENEETFVNIQDCLPDFVELAQMDTTESMDGTSFKLGEANHDQAAGTFENEETFVNIQDCLPDFVELAQTETTEPMDWTAFKLGEANHDQAAGTFENEDCLPDFVELAQTDTTEPMDGTPSKRGEANLDQAAGTFDNETEESRVQTLFEVGENVEIASGRKWYPGNVLKTYMLNGVEMVTVEYSTLFLDKKKMTKRLQESVSSDRIHPQQPSEKLGERKSFELMDKVEAYHNDGWCSGQVRMILNDDTYSVNFNRSTESIKFSLSDLRIPKEWVDGVWKTAKEMEEQQAQSVKPSQEDRAKKGKAVVGKKRRTVVLPEDVVEKMEKEMEEQQAQSVKPSQDDHEKEGKAVVGKKRKATAQPVDLLPFLQREEKRPIGPRNPPMPVTLEVILPIDPFVTPEFPRFSRLGYWMELRGIHCVPFYINGREKEKDFFEYMDNAENNLKEENMANISDDNAMDLRSKLCCEIFDQFMDKDFQEVSRK